MKTVKLGEVCEFKPKKAQAKQLLDAEALVSFAPMEMLPINQKYFTSNEERSLDSVYSSYTYFEENDVIYAKITPCFENGKLSIAKNLKNGVGFGSSEFVPIRCSDEILPEYLYYFLLNPSFIKNGIPKMVGASGHRRVPNEYTENLKIELPSLEEQQRIVARLDTAFEKISRAEVLMRQNLDNVAALQKSILHKYLSASDSTHTHRLSELGIIQTGTTPKTSVKSYYGGEIAFIKPSDFLEDGRLKLNGQRLTDAGLAVGRLIGENSVLMVCIGATIGKVGYTDVPLSCNQQINTITLGSLTEAKYLYYVMSSEEFQSKIQRSANQMTLPIINKSTWSKLTVDLPDLERQKQVIAQLDDVLTKTRMVREKYSKKLSRLKNLRQSLLQAAFLK